MDLRIWIFNREFELAGGLSSYKYLSWKEQYQDRGIFTLIVGDTREHIKMLQQGYFVYMPGKVTAMVIKYVEYDSEQSTITVNGYTTLEFIDQRILLGTYQFSGGKIEEGMKEILKNNLRGFSEISIEPVQGMLSAYESAQYSNCQILEMFTELCKHTGYGMRMKFDYKNKTHIFQIYMGVNRKYGQTVNPPASFSDDWGSLGDVQIIDDESVLKNTIYVFGQGEGANRIYAIFRTGSGTGKDMYELAVDARDLQWQDDPEKDDYQTYEQYIITLGQRGAAKANELIKLVSFKAEITALQDFGIKYNLGDIITCRSNKYNMQLDTRIMAYEHRVENNIAKIYLTLGEPTITAIGEAVIKL